MIHRTRTRLLGVALAGTLLLAACGGDDDPGDVADPVDEGTATITSTVTLVDNAFEPSAPVVEAGDVEVTNEGEAPHTFTIEDADVDVELEAGDTEDVSVELDAGTYTLYCEFHRTQGMETTLTVQ